MGHPARKSKPLVTKVKPRTTVGAIGPGVSCQPSGLENPVPQRDSTPNVTGPLAGLSNEELDMIFCMAVKHHFDQGHTWIPSVLRTMPLLEGINDKTGRQCRIYVRPGKRILMVETLL